MNKVPLICVGAMLQALASTLCTQNRWARRSKLYLCHDLQKLKY